MNFIIYIFFIFIYIISPFNTDNNNIYTNPNIDFNGSKEDLHLLINLIKNMSPEQKMIFKKAMEAKNSQSINRVKSSNTNTNNRLIAITLINNEDLINLEKWVLNREKNGVDSFYIVIPETLSHNISNNLKIKKNINLIEMESTKINDHDFFHDWLINTIYNLYLQYNWIEISKCNSVCYISNEKNIKDVNLKSILNLTPDKSKIGGFSLSVFQSVINNDNIKYLGEKTGFILFLKQNKIKEINACPFCLKNENNIEQYIKLTNKYKVDKEFSNTTYENLSIFARNINNEYKDNSEKLMLDPNLK